MTSIYVSEHPTKKNTASGDPQNWAEILFGRKSMNTLHYAASGPAGLRKAPTGKTGLFFISFDRKRKKVIGVCKSGIALKWLSPYPAPLPNDVLKTLVPGVIFWPRLIFNSFKSNMKNIVKRNIYLDKCVMGSIYVITYRISPESQKI